MLRSGLAPRALLLVLFLISLHAPRPAAAAVSNLRVRPTAFSPNGDNVRDFATVRWDIVADSAACVVLTFQKGTDHREFNLGPRAVGPDSLVWDGLDDQGAILPDGLYSVILEERDDACNAVRSVGSVTLTLDVTAPPIPTYDTPDTLVTRAAFKIQGNATAADSVVLFLGGVPVDTVQTTGVAPDLRYLFDVVLAEGHNSYSVQSWDRAGNFSPQATARDYVYQNTPDVGAISVVPSAFSPNGDGRSDTTRVSFTLDAATEHLKVQVRQGTPPTGGGIDTTVPVVTLYDGPAPAGPQAFTWDGRDSTGTIAGDGGYAFLVRPDSLTITGAPITGSFRAFTLDTTAPPAPYADPVPGATTFRTQLELTAWTQLSDSLRILRDDFLFRTDLVETSISPRASVHLIPLHSGVNRITLIALDAAGNVSPPSAVYTVTFEAPLGFHAPEKFRKGDAFGVNLTNFASSVVIDLYTLRGTPVRQLVGSGSATHYEIPWDLKDTNGAFVGDGPYLARLRVSYPDGSGTEAKGAIVVIK